MADIDYPASLPNPLAGTFGEGERPSWIEDSGEVGAARRRNRFTRAIRSFRFSLRLTDAQKTALVAFYESDLSRGVKAFNWTHPLSGETYEVRFDTRPQIAHMAGTADTWEVEIAVTEI